MCHISYRELVADPTAVVRAVYRHLGLPPDGVHAAVPDGMNDPDHRSDRLGKWGL